MLDFSFISLIPILLFVPFMLVVGLYFAYWTKFLLAKGNIKAANVLMGISIFAMVINVLSYIKIKLGMAGDFLIHNSIEYSALGIAERSLMYSCLVFLTPAIAIIATRLRKDLGSVGSRGFYISTTILCLLSIWYVLWVNYDAMVHAYYEYRNSRY